MSTDTATAQIQILQDARNRLQDRAKRARDRLPALDQLRAVAERRLSGLEEAARVLEGMIRDLEAADDRP